jgi:hypothetical protein
MLFIRVISITTDKMVPGLVRAMKIISLTRDKIIPCLAKAMERPTNLSIISHHFLDT